MAALETVTKEASVFMMRWEIKNAFALMVLSDKKMEPAEVSVWLNSFLFLICLFFFWAVQSSNKYKNNIFYCFIV